MVRRLVILTRFTRSSIFTGYIKGFFEVGKSVENDIKTTSPISVFFALKSVMKFKLLLLCHSLFLEKYNFYYTFQGT